MNQQRLKAERLVYQVMDQLDASGQNTDFWKEEFSRLIADIPDDEVVSVYDCHI